MLKSGMDKTMIKNRNQNHHSASTPERKVREGPLSDVNRDVLYLVMMRLGVVDYVAFSGVCKSWRSFALSNRNIFMASRPPMLAYVSYRPHKKDCYLEDFEGRKIKIHLPDYPERFCIGITCGYLILFSLRFHDFWLVNPITRHELNFPHQPYDQSIADYAAKAVLVFSPSISKWVFVITVAYTKEIWFSTAGQGSWNIVCPTFPIPDLHFFRGKIYTLNMLQNLREGCYVCELRHVCELSFNPEPKLTILETKNLPNPCLHQQFVSSGENLFVVQLISEQEYNIQELDVDEMKWVSHGKTSSEYAIFLSDVKSSAAVKPSSWADSLSRRFADSPLSGKVKQRRPYFWYFPHNCCNVNRLEV